MALITCPNCGKSISDLSEKCIFCNYDFKKEETVKVCPDCGKECDEDAKFCNGCGRPLGEVNSEDSSDNESNSVNEDAYVARVDAADEEQLATSGGIANESKEITNQGKARKSCQKPIKIFLKTLLVLVVLFFAAGFITILSQEDSSSTSTTKTEQTELANEYDQKIGEMSDDEAAVANVVKGGTTGAKVYAKIAEDGRFDTFVFLSETDYKEFAKPVRCVKEIFLIIESLSKNHSDIMDKVGALHCDCQVLKDKLATTEVDMRTYYEGISISGTSTTGEVGSFTFQQVRDYIEEQKNADQQAKQQQEDAKKKAADDAYNKGVDKFAEIYRAYKSNELTADDKFKDKSFTVAGTINGISDDGIVNIGGVTTVTMTTTVDNTVCYWYARFESDKKDTLKSYAVGDNITLKGKCLGWSTFSGCEIV